MYGASFSPLWTAECVHRRPRVQAVEPIFTPMHRCVCTGAPEHRIPLSTMDPSVHAQASLLCTMDQ